MEITINNKTIQLKKTFRSLIAYESATGKSFNPTTVSESIMFFYCVIIASDTDLELSYDDFLDWLDATPTHLQDFTNWLIEQGENEQRLIKKKAAQTTIKTKKK